MNLWWSIFCYSSHLAGRWIRYSSLLKVLSSTRCDSHLLLGYFTRVFLTTLGRRMTLFPQYFFFREFVYIVTNGHTIYCSMPYAWRRDEIIYFHQLKLLLLSWDCMGNSVAGYDEISHGNSNKGVKFYRGIYTMKKNVIRNNFSLYFRLPLKFLTTVRRKCVEKWSEKSQQS